MILRVLMASAAIVTPAYAQETATPATGAGAADAPGEAPAVEEPDPGALDEVIVTARRTAENLQRTPIAVTALTGEQLIERGLSDISEIDRFAPNLQLDTTSTSSGANFISVAFIRGVGQTDFLLTVEPGVATYIDGVYVARNVGAVFDVLDLERVEVLRGPQGTLFGKNTIGGAISVTSRKPDLLGVEGDAQATFGTDDRIDVRGVVSVPLIPDKLAIKLAGSTRNQDGYVRFIADPDRAPLGDINRDTARAAIRWRPIDTLDINIAADFTRIEEQGAPAQGLDFNCPLAPPRPLCGTYNAVRGNPANPASFVNDQYAVSNPDRTYIGQETNADLEQWGVSGNVELELGELTLRSITAFRDMEAQFQRDSDNTPIDLSRTANDFQHDQFSQELQLLGNAFEDRLSFVLGGYYLDESGRDLSSVFLTFIGANNVARIDNQSYAAFAQGSFKLTDQLSLTGGLRYTSEDKELFIDVRGLAGQVIVPAQTARASYENWTPRIGLEYQATDDLLAYGSYSKGFKSGGFNIRYVNPAPSPLAFAPEKIDSYEVGVKAQVLDDRVRINGALFYADYTDLQVVVRNAIATQIVNAAAAEIYGAELEVEAALSRAIRFNGALGYTHAEYNEVPPIVPPATVFDQIELDDPFPKTPEFTASAGLEGRLPVGAGEATARVDYSYRTKVYNDAIGSENIAQEAFSLVNASVGFEAGAGWSVRGFVDNIFDKRYLINGQNGLASVGYAETSYARGREWGVTARFQFGR